MSSAKLWDTISTRKMIAYMEQHYLQDLPDEPQWVDGSGLSRYNLFTPRDFVSVLTKMREQYPQPRLWDIFPTGGKGTLRNYYREQFVHAKTGTLNGCVALSGYLVTKKGKTLVFSVLVNNHNNTATNVRRAVERFLTHIRNNY
jgi:D-alanyl-D-alanine carboxypeptidase/D-alanyl-D-alanine-endopeptidase (penicillin-binding protein 4)